MPKYIITLAGEVVLKSRRTRPRFVKRLIHCIRDAIERAGAREHRIWVEGARVFVETSTDVSSALSRVFGVYRFGEVIEIGFRSLDDLSKAVEEHAKSIVEGRRFAVRVHRVGSHGFTSMDVARAVGERLARYSAGVDLENPDVEVWLEVRGSRAYLYKTRIKGPGGLPTGVEDRVLVLFSGGIDSPVAAWFMARRGCEVDFLHYIMSTPQSAYLAFKVAKALAEKWLHGYRPRFIVVDFRGVTSAIRERVKRSYRQVVLRALMYRAGEIVAEKMGYDALATGESIGQAASQTLINLSLIEEVTGVKRLIARPLLGFDKEDIVEWSRRIGTYELSSRVAEFCALAPTLVVTRAKKRELEEEVSRIPSGVVEEAASSLRAYDLLSTEPKDVLPEEDIEIDYIPDEAVVIDLRSKSEYMKWRHPRAIHVSEVKDWSMFKNRVVVLYCDHGGLSYIQAVALRKQGIKAYSLRGGVKTLLKRIA